MSKLQSGHFDDEHRYYPRKIQLDPAIYCPHSMRQCDGDDDCDHDFEVRPDIVEACYAVWSCTICGRAIRFDIWQ